MSVNSKPKVLNNKISIHSWLQDATRVLKQAGIDSARLDAELILADALEVGRPWLIAHNDELVDPNIAQKELMRREQREPLAYIRGWQEFYGRKFYVTPDVLIPRPESETLIDFLKQLPVAPNAHIVDVGTGSGCLGITAALELPDTSVTLVDVSKAALKVTQRNATLLAHNRTIKCLHSDLLANITARPQVIVANLPYVDTRWERSPETSYEPRLALFAEDDGLALINTLVQQASDLLSSQDYLLLEADVRQLDTIVETAAAQGFTCVQREGYCLALQKN